ncbi:hypothetical protein [Dyella sp. S184]|jgi:hypothetical protein|uniref:hypothetical protein n=1 Tax=Dyella sp. S184 TaxID=1641862 RepID=UPI0020B14D39|nr:hypothetical protein [Dyella sp. S184]
MLRLLIASSLLLLSVSVVAETIDAPMVKAGDSWVYKVTVERGPQGWAQHNEDFSVAHADASTIFVSVKQSGSQQAPTEELAGADWSRSRDINGKQQVVSRPFAFPLEVGKKWELKYTEANPNPKHLSETLQTGYTVVGWEDVEVPAGKFKALKIEAEGNWTAVVAPMNQASAQAVNTTGGSAALVQTNRVTPHTVSGRTYRAFWYVPSVKRLVKSVEESYSSNGIRSERFTYELVSDKVSS